MAATWNPLDCAVYAVLGSGNLAISGVANPVKMAVAVDLTAGKFWFGRGNTNPSWTWINGDPVAGTGGWTLTTATAYFPAWSGNTAAAASANFGGSAFALPIPSGFTAWDAAATWNPADKNASIALSAGNLTATVSTGAAWYAVRGTSSHSTGKWYFELNYTSGLSNNWIGGIMASGATLASYVGSATPAVGFQQQGFVYQNGSNVYSLPAVTWRAARATNGKSSGKWYFEATATALVAAGGGVGVATLANGLLGFPGSTGSISAMAAQWANNAVYSGGANIGSSGAPGSGATIGCAIDLDARKAWFWNSVQSTRWNDATSGQDPATGTGGYTLASPLNTGSLYPTGAVQDAAGSTVLANFGASAFVRSILPTGFLAWDATGAAAARMFLG